MPRKLQLAFALMLVVAIALLFVLPAFDVLPTAMRAWRAAQLIFAALTAFAVVMLFCPVAERASTLRQSRAARDASLDVLDLTCVQLC